MFCVFFATKNRTFSFTTLSDVTLQDSSLHRNMIGNEVYKVARLHGFSYHVFSMAVANLCTGGGMSIHQQDNWYLQVLHNMFTNIEFIEAIHVRIYDDHM